MTAARETSRWISPDEYLESELLSEVRHEYLAGAISELDFSITLDSIYQRTAV
ncbi:MAG TPA: hypothetical protein VIT21_00530 [Chthoniobacterales bacterium]